MLTLQYCINSFRYIMNWVPVILPWFFSEIIFFINWDFERISFVNYYCTWDGCCRVIDIFIYCFVTCYVYVGWYPHGHITLFFPVWISFSWVFWVISSFVKGFLSDNRVLRGHLLLKYHLIWEYFQAYRYSIIFSGKDAGYFWELVLNDYQLCIT